MSKMECVKSFFDFCQTDQIILILIAILWIGTIIVAYRTGQGKFNEKGGRPKRSKAWDETKKELKRDWYLIPIVIIFVLCSFHLILAIVITPIFALYTMYVLELFEKELLLKAIKWHCIYILGAMCTGLILYFDYNHRKRKEAKK